LIIVNPTSGKGDPSQRRKQIKTISRRLGWSGEYLETTVANDAGVLSREAVKKGTKHIVICGGDGTIMEALEAVLKTQTAIGVVPLGTGNLFAKNIGIPEALEDALRIAFFGEIRFVDIGKANSTYFSLTAGMGIDVAMLQGANREVKDRYGFLAYIFSAIKNITYKSRRYRVVVDKKQVFEGSAKSIIVANMGEVTGGITIVPDAHPQNGTLQVGITTSRSLGTLISTLLHAVRGSLKSSPHYSIFRGKRIEIMPLPAKQPYQCDGDVSPPTDRLAVTVLPRSVAVMVSPEEQRLKVAHLKQQAIIFDFDGTLADTLQKVVAIYNALGKKHGYPSLHEAELEELRGKSAREIIASLPVAKVRLPFLLAEGRKLFEKDIESITLFNGLQGVLSELAKHYRLGIVTSNEVTNVKKFLLKHNIDYFDFIYSDSSLFGKGKIIRKVLKKYQLQAENVVYVGDEVRDIEAAKEGGIRVVAVTWGFNAKKVLSQHSPDYLIDKPSQLTKLSLVAQRKK
jgi:phosphoglycolate phosphatase